MEIPLYHMVQVLEVRLPKAEPIFSADATKNAVNTGGIREAFCEIWRNKSPASGGRGF
jgi:hypothetical protein